MSDPEVQRRDSRGDRGSLTAGGGTPVAVDVSKDRQARTIFIVLFGGPVVWFAHFMVVYLVVEAGCTGGQGLSAFEPPVADIVTLAATAVAAGVCLGLAAWARRRWRRGGEGADRDGTLAFAGLLLSLLSFVTVLLVGLPALVLSAC